MMPTTRKQKKAGKSRGLEMLPDIENLDIMLGENHFNRKERDVSLNSNHTERSDSGLGVERENNVENRSLDSRSIGTGIDADYARNSASGNSSAEINRLSSELNSMLSRELDEMMSSVNIQIQRAISDAIRSQILPHIQIALNSGSGRLTQDRWNVPAETPEVNSERFCNEKSRENLSSEPIRDRLNDEFVNICAHDNCHFSGLFENLKLHHMSS